MEDSIARRELLQSQILAELLVCLLVSRLPYILKEFIVLEQPLGLLDLHKSAQLWIEGQNLADYIHFILRDSA